MEQKREQQIRDRMFENRIIYTAPCRLDNWNEDLFLKEEQTNVAIYKRDRCLLTIQKVKKMYRNLLRPTRLSHDLEFVHYGDNYMLLASDVPFIEDPKDAPNAVVYGVYMSGLITDKDIDTTQEFVHGCSLTASRYRKPCVRNTFKMICCDGDKCGKNVNYGEDVYFQIVDEAEVPLFIQCENPITSLGCRMALRLSKYVDCYCRFKILHFNPGFRYDTQGSPVNPNERLTIVHSATGKNLAVEFNKLMPTFFGPECAVTCHMFKDTHKMETAECMWKFVGDPLLNTNMLVRASKGEDVPAEFLE